MRHVGTGSTVFAGKRYFDDFIGALVNRGGRTDAGLPEWTGDVLTLPVDLKILGGDPVPDWACHR